MRYIYPEQTASPSYRRSLTTGDDLRLFTQGWEPESSPHAAVVIVHGYGEHSGRHAHTATHLMHSGYSVHTYDQRGYGRSEGKRAYVDSFDEYTSDLALVVRRSRERYPELPLFIFGHSMGCIVSTLYTLTHSTRPLGLILSAPAFQTINVPWPLEVVSGFISRLFPTLPTLKPDRTRLSRDPEVVDHAVRDTLFFNRRMYAKTGSSLLRANEYIREHLSELTLPLLILQGTADQVVDPEGAPQMYHLAGSTDKTLHLYEGAYHEVLNDYGRDEVLKDVTTWLDAHVEAGA